MKKFIATFLFTVAVFGAPVQLPQLLKQIDYLETSWFASPAIYDLDGDGENELIGTYYSIYVWDKNFNLLDKMSASEYQKGGRIYAPAVIADLDGDGIIEIVAGSGNGIVAAYEWKNGQLSIKAGWPAITYDGAGMNPEVRGLAAADLNHDGHIEIIASNTQTDNDEPQIYVFSPNGQLYQPPGISWNAWPRYNTGTGQGNDADSNGYGNHGYGCFGENLGVGNLDDDPELEIVATYDNHQVNVFDHDGISHLASDYFLNRSSEYQNNRLNWGQFIRWYDHIVESNHYHLHEETWPHPDNQKWCQWTASPCNVIDMNGDGENEVVGIPNVEMDVPYDTKHFSVMVLEGNYGDGSRSARRLAGWESLPGSDYPQNRGDRSWYPPSGIPAPTTANIIDDSLPEIIAPLNDGYIYAFSADAKRLWRYDYTHGKDLMYASEVLLADLNQDNINELIFTTFGDPENISPGQDHGFLVILDIAGNNLFDIVLPDQGSNGNGKGAPAAPTIGDLNGDGNLEIVVQTFGGKCFVYSVPDSFTNSMLWPTGRGNYLRQGAAAEKFVAGGVLQNARANEEYYAKCIAAGGTPPYSWTIVSGTLPNGLNLNTNGTFSGIPTTEGSYTFSVGVSDQNSESSTQQISLTVLAAPIDAILKLAKFKIMWNKSGKDKFVVKGSFPSEKNPIQENANITALFGSAAAVNGIRADVKNTRAIAKSGKTGLAKIKWIKKKQSVKFTVIFKNSNLKSAFEVDENDESGSETETFNLEIDDISSFSTPTISFEKKGKNKSLKTIGIFKN